MSLYTTKPDQFNTGPVAANGIDVDNAVISLVDGGKYQIKDYDILSRPTTSGTGIQIPTELDNGIPYIPEVVGVEDGSNIYGTQELFLGDSTTSLDERLEVVNNGRVGNIEVLESGLPSGDSDLVINKDNRETSIKGIVERSATSDLFFSDMNMDVIHKSIRYGVNKSTGQVVAKQSDNTIYIVMRSIMLQYANLRTSGDNLAEEIRSLNQRVIDYCVENVSSNVQQYLGYIKDIERLPIPMNHPLYHNKNNFTYDISNLL
jgi:hypothetical protein